MPEFISSRSVELLSGGGEKSRGNQEIYYYTGRDWYTNVVCPSKRQRGEKKDGRETRETQMIDDNNWIRNIIVIRALNK